MEDAPPQLGNIPQQSDLRIPTINSDAYLNDGATTNGNQKLQNATQTIVTNAQSAMDTVQKHPLTQNVVDTVSNGDIRASKPFTIDADSPSGPVAETVKDQHAKTTAEFRNLADARTQPTQKAATGQPLTHYHSLFYNLLSWENPRATTITYLIIVASIFAARYLPVLRWTFKALYIVLGLISAVELAGKVAVSQGIISSFRPRKYYTIPRETLESMLEDIEQLINFFVIETQRILLAENLMATVSAFAASLISYWLIKFVPVWGLSLIAVSVTFFVPLIYTNNKEVIDQQVHNASQILNRQASQVKGLAEHHTARATETVKAYAGDYTAKAQNYIGGATKGRSNSPTATTGGKSANTQTNSDSRSSAPSYRSSDFPHAPKQEPTPGVTSHDEQYAQSQFGGQASAVPSY